MGDPGRAPLLIARADPVPHLEGHDRAAVILEQEDPEPVVERGGDDALGGGHLARHQEHDGQEEDGKDGAHRSIIPPASHSAVVSSNLMRVLVVLLVIAIPPLAIAQPCTESLATLFERVSPAVVSIQAGQSRGTGFYIRPDHVLTNAHVIEGQSSVELVAGSTRRTARVTSVSTASDLAVLQVYNHDPQQATLPLGSVDRISETMEVVGK